jgi:hypothetical protein
MRIARFERHDWMQSMALVLFDKVSFYAGRSDSWGIGIELSFYDRSLTFRLLNIYFGVEVWHSEEK